MKIMLTGGGTAGHIYPIVALIEKIKKQNLDYLFVGSSGLESKIAQQNNLNFKNIPVGKWRHYFDFKNFTDIFQTFFGLISAYFLLKKYKPNVVFAKGGYVTFPILFWVRIMRIPLVIHESDMVPGRANIWASKFAQKICTGFPINENYKVFQFDKIVYTGIPVREIFSNLEKKVSSKPVIVVTGGSQGSKKINEKIQEIKSELEKDYEIYNQLGDQNLVRKDETYSYHQFGFEENLPEIMNKADLIIARAGATTLAEIAALAKPAIIIPYPFASMNHQKKNAEYLSKNHAIILLEENNLSNDILIRKIKEILTQNDLSKKLSENINKFACPDAAEEILKFIISEANEKNL